MFKKVLFASAVVVAGLGFTACSSDDDNNPVIDANLRVGEWKAVELSYSFTIPGGEPQTHTFPFSTITNGCDVDELELRANNSVDLETESKVGEVCTEAHIAGTWTDTAITVQGEETPREVVSVTASELVLKYMMEYGNYGTTEVTVKYTRS